MIEIFREAFRETFAFAFGRIVQWREGVVGGFAVVSTIRYVFGIDPIGILARDLICYLVVYFGLWCVAQKRVRARSVLKGLAFFSYLLPRTSRAREDLELSIEDLNLDIEEMRACKFSPFKITLVVAWRSLASIVPIVWAGFKNFLLALSPLAAFLAKVRKL